MSENPSTLAARGVVQGLVDAGVEHVVLCPGSRSAPLAYALHAAEQAGMLSVHVRIDERSAAFTALGMGTGMGTAAVVTTSGTAVANLLPAVWEAHHGLVPLLVLTADRPRRLRGTWANQTTPLQAGAFEAATLRSLDLGCSDPDVAWAQVVAGLVRRAEGVDEDGVPDRAFGPVHLNVGFDDPLVPDDLRWEPVPPVADEAGAGPEGTGGTGGTDGTDDVAAEAEAILAEVADLDDLAAALEDPAAAASEGPDPDLPEVEDPDDEVDELTPSDSPRAVGGELLMWSRRRTLVVAGDGDGAEASFLADPSAYPVLAEPGSNAGPTSAAVPTYRHLLDLPGLGAEVERVVVFGRPTLARPVTRLLARPDVEVVHVAMPGQGGPDREHHRVAGVMAGMARAADLEWLERWLLAGRRARRAVDEVLDGWGSLSGLHVARAVARAQEALPPDGPNLFVAASSVVRDLDLVMDHSRPQPLVHSSRGLSGIDGSLSTAAGIALARSTPVRALVGDLAFLHDANGLLVGPTEERAPVQVVLVDDGGGSIFSLLEHGEPRFAAVHERFFATPHDVDVEALCRAHHVPHRLVEDEAALVEALDGWDGGSEVVQVHVDRSRARALSAAVTAAARAAAPA